MKPTLCPVPSLSEIPTEELTAELLRRRTEELTGKAILRVEEALDEAMTRQHAKHMQSYLQQASQLESAEPKPCPRCGKPAAVRAYRRPRTLHTVSGKQTLVRNYHVCASCEQGFYPLDVALGLPQTGSMTPRTKARVVDLAVNAPYEEAAQRWSVHYGSSLSEHAVRDALNHVMGLPEQVEPAPERPEAPQVLVVQNDGGMVLTRELGWKEVKVAVVYDPQHARQGDRFARGHLTHASYLAELAQPAAFASQLQLLLQARGASEAKRVVWLGDGAPSNWTLCDALCPDALQLLDWYHLMSHAGTCAKQLFTDKEAACREVWLDRVAFLASRGPTAPLLRELELCRFECGAADAKHNALRAFHRYVKTNQARMDYPQARAWAAPIGSGAVESAHRHVIQTRMKLAGQRWSLDKAQGLVRLRAAYRTLGPQAFFAQMAQRVSNDNGIETAIAA